MRINRSSKSLKLAALLLVVLSLSACYTRTEGCLDPDATNYDVTADDECDDCCTYPQLSVLMSQVFGDVGYSRTDTVMNDLGEEFVIEDVQTYLSELYLIDESNRSFRISETIDYTDALGDLKQLADDIILVTPNAFGYDLGTFVNEETYNRIHIRIGVPAVIDEAQSFLVDNLHPLAVAGDSLFVSDQNKFVKTRILLRQIGVHDVADTLQITDPEWSYSLGNFEINQDRGSSLNLNLKIDYKELISEIDYNTMSVDEVKAKIGDNLIGSIGPNI